MYVHSLCVLCLITTEMASYTLTLELWTVVSQHMGTGNQPRSYERTAIVLNYWAISPASDLIDLNGKWQRDHETIIHWCQQDFSKSEHCKIYQEVKENSSQLSLETLVIYQNNYVQKILLFLKKCICEEDGTGKIVIIF